MKFNIHLNSNYETPRSTRQSLRLPNLSHPSQIISPRRLETTTRVYHAALETGKRVHAQNQGRESMSRLSAPVPLQSC